MRSSSLLWRIVRFRQLLHHLNTFFIIGGLVSLSVPGLVARAFFDNLAASSGSFSQMSWL